MPNWCSCRLKVTGDQDELRIFLGQHEGGEFSLGAYFPIPKSISKVQKGHEIGGKYHPPVRIIGDMMSPDCERVELTESETSALELLYGNHDWYQWSIKNWSVKWDISRLRTGKPGETKWWFDTPWTAPFIWMGKVAQDYPSLRFELAFAEGGMEFWGVAIIDHAEGESVAMNNGDFWAECDDEDEDLLVTPIVAEHLKRHELGTGG